MLFFLYPIREKGLCIKNFSRCAGLKVKRSYKNEAFYPGGGDLEENGHFHKGKRVARADCFESAFPIKTGHIFKILAAGGSKVKKFHKKMLLYVIIIRKNIILIINH